MKERVVAINRVSKTVKGGRIFKFAALVVVGDGNGTVGFGIGKAGEVPDAIRKGIEDAKKNLIKISLRGTTIPHEIIGEFGAGRVLMKPAAPGTGVIAGGPVRAVVEAAGIQRHPYQGPAFQQPLQRSARHAWHGLAKLRNAEEVAAIRGKSVKEILDKGEGEGMAQLNIKLVKSLIGCKERPDCNRPCPWPAQDRRRYRPARQRCRPEARWPRLSTSSR